MRHLKLTFLILGLVLFGCNQADSKNTIDKDKISTNTVDEQTKEAEKVVDRENIVSQQPVLFSIILGLFSGLLVAIITHYFSCVREEQKIKKEVAGRCYVSVHLLKNSLTEFFDLDFLDGLLAFKEKDERSRTELLSRVLDLAYREEYLGKRMNRYYESIVTFKALRKVDFYIISQPCYKQYEEIIHKIDNSPNLNKNLKILGDFYSLNMAMSETVTENTVVIKGLTLDNNYRLRSEIYKQRVECDGIKDLQSNILDLLDRKSHLQKDFMDFMNKLGQLEELLVKEIESKNVKFTL